MSEKPITVREARLEIFLARCALDSLRTRFASEDPEAEDPGLFVQPIAESLADVDAALKFLRAFVAQQDPDGKQLIGNTLTKGLTINSDSSI